MSPAPLDPSPPGPEASQEKLARLFPAELAPRYQPVRLLGKGAMGAVFLARELGPDRLVAIKVLLMAGKAALGERMLREARLMAKVRHPNLVEILDQGTTSAGPYLALEFVEGKSLDSVEAGEVDPLEVMLQVGAGLQAMHDAGLIHRDIKPANILVERGGRALVADLGLAFDPDLTRLTGTGIVGTPLYLAPEMLRGVSEPSPASDWYAWGMTLFRLIEGAPPFPPELVLSLLTRRLDQPWPRPSWKRTPPGSHLALTIDACLAEDPGDRPADLGELRRLLAVDGPGTTTAPLPQASRLAGTTTGGRRPGLSSSSRAGIGQSSGAHPLASASGTGLPPSSRRALGLRVGVGLGIALLALGWALGRGAQGLSPAPPATSGPPATPATPPEAPDAWLDADLGDRILADLEQADDLAMTPYGRLISMERASEEDRPLLDPDPILWRKSLAAMDDVDRVLRWIGDGGRVEELPAEVRAGLARADEGLEARDLPPLFRVYLETHPSDTPATAPQALRVKAGLADHEAVFHGWGATAIQALTEGLEGQAELQQQLDRDPKGPIRGGEMVAVSGFVGATSLDEYLGGVGMRRGARLQTVEWIREVVVPVRRFLYAAGRSLREEEGDIESRAKAFADGVRMVDAMFHHHFITLRVEELIGGPPIHPGGWMFAGEMLRKQTWRMAALDADADRGFEQIPSFFQAALAPPWPDARAMDRRWHCIDRLLENATKIRDDEAFVALVLGQRQALAEEAEVMNPDILITIALYVAEYGLMPGLSVSHLEEVLGACRRRLAAFQDLGLSDAQRLETSIERLAAHLERY